MFWQGGGQPITIDWTAPIMPMFQGPAAFLGGYTNAKREAKSQQSQADANFQNQQAQQWSGIGRSVGGALGQVGTVAAVGALNPDLVSNPDFQKAFIADALVKSGAAGSNVSNYVQGQQGLQNDAAKQYIQQNGMTQQQGAQMGQRIMQSAPPDQQAQMLQQYGFGSPEEFSQASPQIQSQIHSQIGGQTIQRQQAQQQIQLGMEAQAAQALGLQDAHKTAGIIQGMSSSPPSVGFVNPKDQQDWNDLQTAKSNISKTYSRPEDQAQALAQIQQKQAQFIGSRPDGAFKPILSPQQQIDQGTVKVNGHVFAPVGRKGEMHDTGVQAPQYAPGQGIGDKWPEVDPITGDTVGSNTRHHDGNVVTTFNKDTILQKQKEFDQSWHASQKALARTDPETGAAIPATPEEITKDVVAKRAAFQTFLQLEKADSRSSKGMPVAGGNTDLGAMLGQNDMSGGQAVAPSPQAQAPQQVSPEDRAQKIIDNATITDPNTGEKYLIRRSKGKAPELVRSGGQHDIDKNTTIRLLRRYESNMTTYQNGKAIPPDPAAVDKAVRSMIDRANNIASTKGVSATRSLIKDGHLEDDPLPVIDSKGAMIPPAKRSVGKLYQTKIGPMRWTGKAWTQP